MMNKPKSNNRRRPSRRRGYRRPSQPKGKDLSMYVNEGSEAQKPEPYKPQHGFEDFYLYPELYERVKRKGYKSPTEVQDQCIPLIMEDHNVIGVAGTGTGKTAAFLLPVIQKIMEDKRQRYALIVAPTRELAFQINDEFRSLVKGLDIYSTCLIGGTSVRDSIISLKRTNHIIIGTPGRLMDMQRQGRLKLHEFNTLVLDEFDRMLDMGFKKEMQALNELMTSKQQTLLFSATIDPSQEELIQKIIGGPSKRVKAATDTQKTDAIKQDVLYVNGQNKFDLMHGLLKDEPKDKVILFCETKRKADRITKKLKNKDVKTDTIHGDKSQSARDKALRKFKKGQINVLVATDVVARGIDVDDVSLVINYEIPRNYSDYVHRIGRTGRAGKKGRAVTLVD